MATISVSIKQQLASYNIEINEGYAEKEIKKHEDNGCYFVIDANVYELYKEIMPADRVYIFEASEVNKNLANVEKILDWLKNNDALRDSKLMAVGGGIVGDTAGFAASLYMRGIKLIQMPTTVLAMVDSAVGGKNGVNFKGIKNNIGCFYQPSEVIIDTNFIKTLSEEEYLNGLAESLKISCVYGSDFFYFLQDNKDEILQRDISVLNEVIAKSCSLKARIVERDEKEGGLRKLLNFGHTVAHAIETDSGYKIHHGYAVALGMVYESYFALINDYTDQATFDEIKNIIESFGYGTYYSPINKQVFENAISKDKKASITGLSLAFAGSGLIGRIIGSISPDSLIESIFEYNNKRR